MIKENERVGDLFTVQERERDFKTEGEKRIPSFSLKKLNCGLPPHLSRELSITGELNVHLVTPTTVSIPSPPPAGQPQFIELVRIAAEPALFTHSASQPGRHKERRRGRVGENNMVHSMLSHRIMAIPNE